MAVLFDKDKNEMIMTCDCGCGTAINMKIEKEELDDNHFWLISYIPGSSWYIAQYKALDVIKVKVKKIWNIIRSKDHHYSEIYISKEEFKQFRDFVNSVKTEEE